MRTAGFRVGRRRVSSIVLAVLVVLAEAAVVHAAAPCDLPARFPIRLESRGATEPGGPGVVAVVDGGTIPVRVGDLVRQANGSRVDGCADVEAAAGEALAKGLALLLGVERGGVFVGLAVLAQKADEPQPPVPVDVPPPPAGRPASAAVEGQGAEPAAPQATIAPIPASTPVPLPDLPGGASPRLRRIAEAAAITLGTVADVADPGVLPALYDQRIHGAEVVVDGLAFDAEEGGSAVRAFVEEILGYYRAARDIQRMRRGHLEKRGEGGRVRTGGILPYFSDSQVPTWIAQYPFLRETILEPPRATRVPIPGETAGSFDADAAVGLLWERARARTTELESFAAGG